MSFFVLEKRSSSLCVGEEDYSEKGKGGTIVQGGKGNSTFSLFVWGHNVFAMVVNPDNGKLAVDVLCE